MSQVVDALEPQQQAGCYWGYSVRLAKSISRAVKECPHKAGYDLVIGTSSEGVEREVAELVLPQYKHALVVFGGVQVSGGVVSIVSFSYNDCMSRLLNSLCLAAYVQ